MFEIDKYKMRWLMMIVNPFVCKTLEISENENYFSLQFFTHRANTKVISFFFFFLRDSAYSSYFFSIQFNLIPLPHNTTNSFVLCFSLLAVAEIKMKC